MAKRKTKVEAVAAWAFEIDNPTEDRKELCYWALPNKIDLLRESLPSPEAKPVKVRIIRDSDYRRLLRSKRK